MAGPKDNPNANFSSTAPTVNSSSGGPKNNPQSNISDPSKRKKKSGGGSPDNKLAKLLAKDFKRYKKDFLPVEKKLIKNIEGDEGERKAAKKAKKEARLGFNQAKSSFNRELSRTGVGGLDGVAADQAKRENQLARKQTVVGAANLARRGRRQEDSVIRQNLIQAGQGLRGQALQGLGQAGSMSNQREAAGDANAAQQRSNTMSNVGTGAAVGMMAGMQAGSVGGPYGAAIGAGVGLLVSMF